MKKIAICIWGAISGTILLSHCTFSDKGVRKIDQQGDKLYVCVHHEVKDSVVIPLSELVKEVHIEAGYSQGGIDRRRRSGNF